MCERCEPSQDGVDDGVCVAWLKLPVRWDDLMKSRRSLDSGAKLTDSCLNGNIYDLSLQLTGFQSVLHDMIIAH